MIVEEKVNGNLIASLCYEEYFIDGFDWVLIYDVFVKERFRKRGIMKKMVFKLKQKFENLYLAVKIENKNAILAYKKVGFCAVRKYKNYYIMALGDKNKIYQLKKCDFNFD